MSARKNMTAILGVILVSVAAVPAAADQAGSVPSPQRDFRVESKVFVGSSREPAVTSTTIFSNGIVYDYLNNPAEVTVFDPRRGRFILLDEARRVQTEISTEFVATFIARLRERAAAHSDPMTQFMAAPQFDETFDEESGELIFANPMFTYRVVAEAVESPALAEQYRDFSDWHAKLNTLLVPGTRLPFARMLVNQVLFQRQEIPLQVRLEMIVRQSFPARHVVIRSEHQVIPHLVESDRRRVAQTGQFLAMFQRLSFEEYQEKIAP